MWKRIVLWLLLLISVAFNYMIWQDNERLSFRIKLLEHEMVDDYIGYDYCP